VDFVASAPKEASDFDGLTVSLKRYPDTKPKFFRSRLGRLAAAGGAGDRSRNERSVRLAGICD